VNSGQEFPELFSFVRGKVHKVADMLAGRKYQAGPVAVLEAPILLVDLGVQRPLIQDVKLFVSPP